MFQDATSRFSRTVENYIRYRPGYPKEVLTFLKNELNFNAASVIADIGSGTGKSSELFLQNGNVVFAVEPNPDMRRAAEQLLHPFPNFKSINGSAEATTLPAQSIDFIVAGTAFHWFEPKATRQEFQRIIKSDGFILLMWNVRNNERSDFMPAYEDFLLNHATDYKLVREVYHSTSEFDDFFGNNHWQRKNFVNSQVFDFEGLLGRYLSCSYAFPENHAHFADAKAALRVIFDEHQENETVTLWYDTALYYGKF